MKWLRPPHHTHHIDYNGHCYPGALATRLGFRVPLIGIFFFKPSVLPNPASCLPTEILLKIFAFCVAPDQSNDEAFTALHIVRISHVCHVWREISLAYPSFWSNIAFKTPYLATTMIERSKPLPIAVRANLTPGGGKHDDNSYPIRCMFKAVSRALRNSDRAKEILLRTAPSARLTKAFQDIRPTSSQLEYLALRGYGDSSPSTVFDVPSSIFAHCVFPLKTLILERCKVVPSILTPHCARLTHLELHSVPSFNVGELVAIFRPAASSLQSIILDTIPIPGGVFKRIQHTSFPNLSVLNFSAPNGDSHAHNVFFLLHFMTIPVTATLNLQFLILGPTWQMPAPIIPTLGRHFSSGDPIRSLIIFQSSHHKRRGLRIQGWTEPTLPRFFYAEEAPPPIIDVHWVCEEADDGGSLERILTDLVSVGPLHAVQALTIARVTVLSAAAVDGLLLMLPSLREVCIHGSASLRALCGLEPSGGPITRSPPLARLRELQSLTIYEASFRNGGTQDVDLHALRTCLDDLSAKGCGITELIVCYSDAWRQDMEELAKHARQFLWDGSMNGTTSVPVPFQTDPRPVPV
jgi:F-box associated protein